jgi:GT2 family glycosyltransferase
LRLSVGLSSLFSVEPFSAKRRGALDPTDAMTGDLLFWIGLGALAYAYLGYPLLLAFVATILRQAFREAEQNPAVSLIVAAHNEAALISNKIENTFSLNYPADRLQLIVVSDASTDGTDEIVRRCRDPRVTLLRQEPQAGKSAALNRGVEEATGEILVFSDANSMFSLGALRALVRPFADSRIGAVSGALEYEADGAHTGEGMYWRYEQVMKGLESRIGRLLGANGAIFAVRRELVPRLHPLDVNDFRIPYQALLEGRAAVLARAATASERAGPTVGGEMARKVRIMSRALPMFFSLLPPTLRAGRPLVAWQLLSQSDLAPRKRTPS